MRLTFELESDVSSSIDKMKDKPLRIIAKQWREKRSLDANAYYWVLLSRLAEAAGISKPRAHNLMLRRYGQNLMIAGQMAYLVVPDTTEAEETALEAETFHIRPTSQVKQGKPPVHEALLRGCVAGRSGQSMWRASGGAGVVFSRL